MNKILIILLSAICIIGKAQTYPYNENFSLQISNQVPSNWGGDVKVALAHGTNDSKGLAALMSSLFTDHIAITPNIGPLTGHSVMTFFYRIVDKDIYPSTPTNLVTGDLFQVQASYNGGAYQTVLQVDENNHNPSLNFVKKKIFLTQNAGDTLHIKFNYHFGGTGGGYYVDVDSIIIQDDPNADIAETPSVSNLSIYPNPVSAKSVCNVKAETSGINPLLVFDALGRKLFTTTFVNTIQLPQQNWAPGIYFVQVGNLTRKLIVQQ